MPESVCIFEDPQYVKLLPLVYTRPVYDLRCGILTLREKIRRTYPKTTVSLLCRSYLTDVVREQNPGAQANETHSSSSLFINGRLLADATLAKQIPVKGKNAMYLSGNTVVAFRINTKAPTTVDFSESFDIEHFAEFEKIQTNLRLIEYPWELVKENAAQIVLDFKTLVKGKKLRGKIYPGVHFLNRKNIFVDSGASVKPGAVLDAENGPIYIGKNATIFPNAFIEGPAYIGDGSLIKSGARIYEGSSIGPMCKVGGEVESSIIHSHSNKQHDGFLGHSYVGKWCNLGADTNTSDLKNNYSSVKVQVNGEVVDSGLQFVGLTMGDHSKSGINTMFNTGTVVGMSSNVFGAGFPPKFIPSFSWNNAEKSEPYDIEKAVEVARVVMGRRKVEFSSAEEILMRKLFELTARERGQSSMQK